MLVPNMSLSTESAHNLAECNSVIWRQQKLVPERTSPLQAAVRRLIATALQPDSATRKVKIAFDSRRQTEFLKLKLQKFHSVQRGISICKLTRYSQREELAIFHSSLQEHCGPTDRQTDR